MVSAVSEPTLSLAVMVKNDAVRLRRAIDSCRDFVDEVVVLDTGSSDDSVFVAKECGAGVIERSWPGEFDTALNWLLDEIKTDWVLRLDSDEWFEESPGSEIRGLIQRPDIFVIQIIRRDYLPEDRHSDLTIPRIWRNHPQMRYQGIIHEQFTGPTLHEVGQGRLIYDSAILLHHDGYRTGSRTDRLRRNEELIRQELEKRPGQLYYEICLVDTLAELQEPEAETEREALFDRVVKTQRPPEQELFAVPLAKWMIEVGPDRFFHPQTGKRIRYALQHYPRVPGMLWACADLEQRRGNLREALEIYLALDRMGETGEYDQTLSVNRHLISDECWMRIVQLGTQLGRHDAVAMANHKLETWARMHSAG